MLFRFTWLRHGLLLGCLHLGTVSCFATQASASAPPESEVSVRVVIAAESAPGSLFEIILRAEPIEPPDDLDAKALELNLRAPWRCTLSLDRTLAWRLSLKAEGFWAPETTVRPTDESVVLTLFSTGLLIGRLTLPVGEPMPAETEVQLSSTPGSQSQTRIAPTTFRCPVAKGRWSCEVPSGRLDLRLSAAGFIPHYFWDAAVKPRHSNNLGTLQLTRGASLAGWVTLAERDPDQTPVQIVLERQVSGWQGNPLERQRLEALTLRGQANERGFFQLRGIPAAGYRLRVTKPGFAPQQISQLTVEELQESFLDDPIVLYPPATLEVVLEPPLDPAGRSWLVTLGQLEPGSAVLTDRAETTPAVEGALQIAGLESGSFLLMVDDASGSTWVSRWVEVEPGMGPIFVDVPVVPVEGSVTSGGDPVRATVAFGSTQGAVQIHMETDEDGRFEGFLPREGKWPIDLVFTDQTLLHQAVDAVEVRKRLGQRAASVEIALADTLLTGQVLAEAEAEPVPSANLAVLRQGENRRREAILKADGKGEFELRGLAPGDLLIKAYKGTLSSSWQHVELLEGRDPKLRLVLRRKVDLSGLVLSPVGEVPGAEVAGVPRDTLMVRWHRWFGRSATSTAPSPSRCPPIPWRWT